MDSLATLIEAAQKESADVAASQESLGVALEELAQAQAVVAEKQTAAGAAQGVLVTEKQEAIAAWTSVQTAVGEIIAGLRG